MQKVDAECLASAQELFELLKRLFPICRSITGDGVRQTLAIIKEIIPINTFEVPTGTEVFDWVVPEEWNIREAYIQDEDGRKIVDFKQNNLHVVGYSIPVDQWMSLSELQKYLYSIEDQPTAIPYVTSYYERNWGFCLSHEQRRKLKEGRYRVFIDSELKNGSMTYAELLIPGESKKEIFLSCNICHPSLANNELSGPVVMTFIARWLLSQSRRYSYRIVFVPETIGALSYLKKNLTAMKSSVIAGFTVACIGDEGGCSVVSSRYGDTLADKVARHVLAFKEKFTQHSFVGRGSDERQYCSPDIDLPLVALCRSKFEDYPEYHTSLDNLSFVTPAGLLGGFQYVRDCLEALENNRVYRTTKVGEPRLDRAKLWPSVSIKGHDRYKVIRSLLDVAAYADGRNDLIDIGNIIGVSVGELAPLVRTLCESNIVEAIE